MTINSSHITDSNLEILWNLLDYGWLTDPARPSTSPENVQEDVFTETVIPKEDPHDSQDPHDPTLPTQNYDLISDYDVDHSILGQHDVSLDFINFEENIPHSWLETPTDMPFTTNDGLPSPWTPHLTG